MATAEILNHIDTQSIYLVALGAMAFSRSIKKQVRKEQNNCCAECGEKTRRLETHHIQPSCKGGADTRENAVGLCRPCHIIYDRHAFEKYEREIHQIP